MSNTAPESNTCFGMRHVHCILLFIIIVTIAGMRNILNVAIIAMITDNPPNENIPTYPEWEAKKNVMLSSFFWGYIVFQVIAGEVAKKYGPKYLLGITMCINSIFCVLLPFFGSKFGYLGVIACRVIQGLTQGPLLPCCHNLLSKWIPSQERGKLGNFVYAGSPLGVLIALPVAGVVCSSSVGWPAIFYIYGGIGIVWSIFWLIFGSNSPATDRFISAEERNYIQIGKPEDEDKTFATPWRAIFTSAPFYAILICHCGQNLGYWILLIETPSFMEKILNFNLASSSLLTALPYLVQWVFSNIVSPIADLFVIRGLISTATSRKLCNSIGMILPSVGLFSLIFVKSSQSMLTLVVLITSVGLNGSTFSGFMINHMDISPIHAGTLMGIGNSIGNIFALLAPLSVDAIANISGYNETQKELWNIVFSLAGVVYLATGLQYVLLGSASEQPWSVIEDRKISELRRTEPLRKISVVAQSI